MVKVFVRYQYEVSWFLRRLQFKRIYVDDLSAADNLETIVSEPGDVLVMWVVHGFRVARAHNPATCRMLKLTVFSNNDAKLPRRHLNDCWSFDYGLTVKRQWH